MSIGWRAFVAGAVLLNIGKNALPKNIDHKILIPEQMSNISWTTWTNAMF